MKILFELLGGLGLFLYGMTIMGDGLEKTAGDKMKKIIEVLTNNRIIAVIVGALVTMIIQSSSATTVMVVGFVNAGIMTLTQATGIIMGANIGTTITAQIASLNISAIAPIAVGISVAIWMFSDNKKTKNAAEIFIGFGILFIGMDFMKEAVKPLREYEGFTHMLLSFGKPTIIDSILAVLAGFAITAIVQSSSASTGLLIALASEGLLPIEAAMPIVFGTNIGTCVTAMLSSIGANRTAKRAAFIHFLFNIIGTIIFMIFFRGVTINLVKSISPDSAARQLANAHTLFNITNTLLLLPFAGLLVRFANRVIPKKDYEDHELKGIRYLDDRILETPSIAMVQVIKETLNMGDIALESYQKSMEAFFKKDEKIVHEVFKLEKIVNSMERSIAEYLVKLSNTSLSAEQHEMVDGLINTINDIERVGDHSDNLAELAMYTIEHNIEFSEKAMQELNHMHERVVKSYNQSILALKTGDMRIAKKVAEREGEIDLMEKTLRANHIARLNRQSCSAEAGVIFLDIISNLERIGDHASNIALAVLDTTKK
ncbi:Na/Pi cotransporter family protein [Geosporobacter ferrireducens]|uniref:Sodium-dependent phosphate transporter n=1 Tax=Geosporobacter ferrireducens TaxID=1424294 RepID=A0A1D8GN78_9FIRM|nr:Na/Pi cotransporter family protein [Geosporobacter ferrireducens]AOT72406.1 sodium-dependent phosphate transporter [Geosporobacter ferrireducens]MTI56337.1 Na/Pi cotransporter family protein [Geosporobacter ferrireducens]